MNNVFKASAVLITGVLSSSIAGFIYGWAGYNFDLFLVFPFVVAALIIMISMYTSEVLLYNNKRILFVFGIMFGIIAYIMYLYGGYIALSNDVQRQILRSPEYGNITSEELRIIVNRAVNQILQTAVGITGLVGWLIFKSKASISPFYSGDTHQGQGSYVVGAIAELFKLGCMTVVPAIALRDITGVSINLKKDAAYQEIIERQRQEKLAKKIAQKQADAKSFLVVVVITLAIVFIPLLLFIISLYLY